jgi:UDP:flavonoid glycosyltransferase YjiC (YdhE family)
LTLLFYISSHGFGHATRDFEVIRELHQRQPESRIVIRSAIPRWFLERSLNLPVDLQPVETDIGVVQIDSLRLDEEETARQAGAFYRTFADRVTREAAVLRTIRPSIVVGDVPPVAFAAAAAAGIPSIALANFTWDWIYDTYDEAFARLAPDTIGIIGEAYARTSLALRLPFAGGFGTMPRIVDIPLIGRRSQRARTDTRTLLKLNDERPIVLASFGGHGAELPLETIVEGNDIVLLATDHETGTTGPARHRRLRQVTGDDFAAHDLRYEDLVAAADIVISKPGYGIVSECIANGTPLIFTSRGRFAENPIIIEGMKPYLKTAFIEQDDLRAGRWKAAIERVMHHPAPSQRMELNGASVAADWIRQTASAASIQRL